MSSWFFLPTFFDFGWILDGFWKDLERYLEGRFVDFSHFSHKLRFCVNVNKTLRGRMNFQGPLSKKHVNFQKKPEKIEEITGLEKTRAKFTQLLNLGRSWAYQAQVWEGLGILLGAFGRLLVVFCTF